MTKFRKVAGLWLKGALVVLQTVVAAIVPAKFAGAVTRDDDGAHKAPVVSDRGLRFELDEQANAALGEAERYVQVAQAGGQRSAEDVAQEGIRLLSDRGVDVQALSDAGVLDAAVQTLIAEGDIAPPDTGSLGDVGDVVEALDVSQIEEILVGS
ncbi:hypothetical protein [Minwuia thermotolerans]|uniref:Uncharacterized protein n=1 Tax=Minwuia thermotolerans TaxID=2056226 RepID=A0A2M9G5I8_9PROT|nr:hypothetical protein [Minwuia thermotolerans]PJK30972.1 hypothetical protein CVT23_03665 [Minwuia thermotolerans]